MIERRPALWQHPDFLKLWVGQSVSLVGSQITLVALPLTAIGLFAATPAEIGLLGAAQFAPYLLFGLVAGAWVDRVKRRPVLIAADLGRAALVGAVPLAVLLGVRSMLLLYVVGFLSTTLFVFAGSAHTAFVPALIPRDRLVDGNGKLELTRSLARIAGPSLGGALVQVLTAPVAMVFDALSFLVSAFCLGLIRHDEARPPRPEAGPNIRAEIAQGLGVVLKHPMLRLLATFTAIGCFFDSMLFSVSMLYLTVELGLEPATIGVILAMLGVGALAGSALAPRLHGSVGPGIAISWSAVAMGLAYGSIPAAALVPDAAAAILPAATGLLGLGSAVYNINLLSVRQAITPDHLQGRVNGTMQFLTFGMMPVGAALGGAIGEWFGVTTTVAVAALGIQIAVVGTLLSPIRTLREQPTAPPTRA